MISKKYIKLLDFNTIEDIYNYIIDSYINGAIRQTEELINKLSKEQFKNFVDYLQNNPEDSPVNSFELIKFRSV